MSDTCIKAYEEIRNGKTHRYAIFMIVDNKIEVEQIGNQLRFNNRQKMHFQSIF